ncbi:MAG: hypothetical protein RLZZ432_408, partial [Chloroflexota bacterium]
MGLLRRAVDAVLRRALTAYAVLAVVYLLMP